MKTQEQIKAEIKKFQELRNQYPTDSTIQFSLRALEWVITGGDCPFCGGESDQTAKHSDLYLNLEPEPMDYDDITIHRCRECGKYHSHIG